MHFFFKFIAVKIKTNGILKTKESNMGFQTVWIQIQCGFRSGPTLCLPGLIEIRTVLIESALGPSIQVPRSAQLKIPCQTHFIFRILSQTGPDITIHFVFRFKTRL